jgi:F-box/TPR repeat protein Pof3
MSQKSTRRVLIIHQAIHLAPDQYILYDSRSAVYDRLGRPKDALRDAKQVITLAPDRWQGYSRSARVFVKAHRHDSALAMVDLALERVKHDDTKRRDELNCLKDEALRLRDSAVERNRRPFCHFGLLPVEICSEIFKEVVSCDPAQVLVVSSVCRQWRVVALNTAALWGTLVLSGKHLVARANLWVKRSKGQIRELCVLPGDALFTKNLDLLNSLSWEVLRTLKLDSNTLLLPPISALSTLESLEISRSPDSMGSNAFLARSKPNNSLRSLTLNQVYFDWAILLPHFNNLVSLVIRQVVSGRPDLILAVLEANPKLERLIVDSTYVEATEAALASPIRLPRLTHLESCGTKDTMALLYNLVDCPSLQKLILSRHRLQSGVFVHVLETPLTELRIHRCGVAASTLIPFLRLSSSLETLELSHLSGVANEVAEALAAVAGDSTTTIERGSPMCPSLAYIDFSHCDDLKSGPLVRLVKSRLHPVSAEKSSSVAEENQAPLVPAAAQISTLIVDGCPLVDSSVLPWLRSKVQTFSCVYMTKKAAAWKR